MKKPITAIILVVTLLAITVQGDVGYEFRQNQRARFLGSDSLITGYAAAISANDLVEARYNNIPTESKPRTIQNNPYLNRRTIQFRRASSGITGNEFMKQRWLMSNDVVSSSKVIHKPIAVDPYVYNSGVFYTSYWR